MKRWGNCLENVVIEKIISVSICILLVNHKTGQLKRKKEKKRKKGNVVTGTPGRELCLNTQCLLP